AGTPLAEIVTEPDIRSPAEAKIFLQELRLMMRYLDVSDADMEKGHLRCDANISLRPRGEVLLSPKTEIKNLNSFRSVERALTYEIGRQAELWDAGTPDALQTTRGWDETKGETVLQRTKEEASDYRYFPEPDIPPLHLTSEYVRNITAHMPELPEQRRLRFAEQYILTKKDIDILVNDKDLGDFFEKAASELQAWLDAEKRSWATEGPALMTQLANWLINRLQKLIAENKQTLSESNITPENFAEFVKIVASGSVNNQGAQKILTLMSETGHDPSDILEREGLGQMQDAEKLVEIVQRVIDANPKVVGDVRAGKEQAKKFLVGKVMAATKGTANPQMVAALLDEKLSA
ncbi:MAG: Asp-tRNA(Asn)/Glu-tRNA(Gln) amidotransferase subunit GatB, partial [Candidatus Kerfeldbacteria bacterium]|nr:Asp-tRNA(Asn)/Glu-tRNA(Gln) amidotransferase subunit GatB [Candidatus Kerfeldbacteria bacterium]